MSHYNLCATLPGGARWGAMVDSGGCLWGCGGEQGGGRVYIKKVITYCKIFHFRANTGLGIFVNKCQLVNLPNLIFCVCLFY